MIDYENITGQDIVNMVWSRLNDGTGRSIVKGDIIHPLMTQCQYLSPNGNKCAVGIFLPDGHEVQKVQGAISKVLLKFKKESDADWYQFLEKNYRLLDELQRIHDTSKNWDGDQFIGHVNFQKFCKDYGFEFPGDIL